MHSRVLHTVGFTILSFRGGKIVRVHVAGQRSSVKFQRDVAYCTSSSSG